MDLTPYIDSLREDLTATAAAGDEQTQRAAGFLSAALEPAIRLALMNALADLAADVTASLPEHVVEVRLDGRDVRVAVTNTTDASTETGQSGQGPHTAGSSAASSAPFDGDVSRMTLRLFEQIKDQAEQAAAAQGVSLNTFVSQAVQGALQGKASPHSNGPTPHGKHTDSHLRGWARG